jgi:RNA polymerase sigma-70 factor (ECF subfamily)
VSVQGLAEQAWALREVMFRVAYRLTNSAAEAEEIVLECLAGAAAGKGRFNPTKGTAQAYLLAAVRNAVLRRARRREETGEVPEVADWRTPEAAALQAELREAVARAVGRLPPLQREALVLAHYERMSAEEIAEVVGAEAGAVKSRLQRARASLREMLAEFRGVEVER